VKDFLLFNAHFLKDGSRPVITGVCQHDQGRDGCIGGWIDFDIDLVFMIHC